MSAALFSSVLLASAPFVTNLTARTGYNSWPMIQSVGNRLVCAYSRGSGHTIGEGARGVWAQTSDDGGRTWSAETLVANDPGVGEVTIGKGLDSSGAMLLWIRCWSSNRKCHHLYRTADGVRFERIAAPAFDPMPMQVTDVFSVPGVGLVSLWFSAGYREGQEKSWGTLVSADDGRTWTQRTVESGLKQSEWPTEPSAVFLGDGKILALARSEGKTGHQFQLVSSDSGRTWRKSPTNIRDVAESTPSLVYDPKTGLVSNYYYHRGAKLLKRRVARASQVFDSPTDWPEPTVLFRGREIRAYDAGNANAVACGSRQFVATYTGSPTDTEIVVVSVPD